LVLDAHAEGPHGDELLVFAAASLTDVLPRVLAARPGAGAKPVFSFDASSKLARQIEAGAPAAVFIAADRDWMDYLEDRHLLVPGTRSDLVGNRLVFVVPRGSAFRPASAQGLVSDKLRRLALAAEVVPAGRYARAALEAEGVLGELAGRVVTGDNVRSTLAWVARGEADGAVVYLTDARVEPKVEITFTFPAKSHPRIVYPVAVVARQPQVEAAKQLVAWLRSDEARKLFEAAGFERLSNSPR